MACRLECLEVAMWELWKIEVLETKTPMKVKPLEDMNNNVQAESSLNPSTHKNGDPLQKRKRPFRFFKVVLPSNLTNKKLKIPPKFVSIFHDELADVALLTTPTGQAWPVRLEKGSGNNWWFSDGWQKFLEHHSIEFGYFLSFEYERDSTFRVSIFDLTTCEISYPSNPSIGSENQSNRESSFHFDKKLQEDLSVEILGSNPPFKAPTSVTKKQIDRRCSNRVKREHLAKSYIEPSLEIKNHYRNGKSHQSKKSEHVCFRENKKCKMESQMFDHYQTESDEDDSFIELERESQTWGESHSTKGHCRTKNREKSARVPPSLNLGTPSFTITLKQYHVEKRFLHVPSHFSREYLRKDIVKLLDSSGRHWPVKSIHQGAAVRLSKGWSYFSREKNLKVGDVCTFEFLPSDPTVLKIHIFQQ